MEPWNRGTILNPIYLDSHATTPVDPRVLDAMLPYFTEHFGNASSRNHPFGWKAGKAVEHAREQVAALDRRPVQRDRLHERRHRVQQPRDQRRSRRAPRSTAATSSPSRPNTAPYSIRAERSSRDGFRVTVLGVNRDGQLDLEKLRDAMTDDTLLFSVMSGNNEIGVLHPLADIARLAHERGALFHCDAVQSAGVAPHGREDISGSICFP